MLHVRRGRLGCRARVLLLVLGCWRDMAAWAPWGWRAVGGDGGRIFGESTSPLGRGSGEGVHDFVQLQAPCSAIDSSVLSITDGEDEQQDDDDCHRGQSC